VTRARLKEAKLLHDLLCRRLEDAERTLRAGLLRLSALDAEIARLCIECARIAGAGDDAALSIASIEARRRAILSEIERLKKERHVAVAVCDQHRGTSCEILRRKIAVESALAAMEVEVRPGALRR